MDKFMLSVIVPVFNEQEVLKISNERFTSVLEALRESLGCDYELIYIDDGSSDKTFQIVEELCAVSPRVKALRFSRNFGHQMAVTAGMDAATGDCAVVIDADLQDPPEIIPEMIRKWREGYEVVYGKRTRREGETFFKKFTAFAYYRVLAALSPVQIPLDTGDFRLIDRVVLNALGGMREHNRFLRGMSAWAGFRSAPVEYRREERAAGKTKYTLKKMLKLAGDGIFGFSGKPLIAPFALGCAVMALSAAGFLATAVCALCRVDVAPWLWAFLGLALMQGSVLLFMGAQGAYLARMYDELKGRPLYVLRQRVNFSE